MLLDVLSYSFRRRAGAKGVRTNSAFAGAYDFRREPDFAKLFPHFLHRLPPESVVMCHPGVVDDELKRLDPLTIQREREYAYLAERRPARHLGGLWPCPELNCRLSDARIFCRGYSSPAAIPPHNRGWR